jgi:tRNA(fMet)-specific endonuclease VapC
VSRYCVDTSAYSRFQRGDPEVVDLMDRAEWIGIPSVTLGELRTGFLLGSRAAQNEADLSEFLSSPVVTELTVDGEVSRHYAEMVVDLRRAGTPVPTNDLWIAATAARAGALVLTADAHFERITRVGSVIVGRPPEGL